MQILKDSFDPSKFISDKCECLPLQNGSITQSRIVKPLCMCVMLRQQHELLSLSTLVLNSRDWSEIVRLPEISRFKFNLAISLIRKKPAGMHWLGYNDAVSSLKEAKTRIFQPTANFENFEIRLYFVSLPASLP